MGTVELPPILDAFFAAMNARNAAAVAACFAEDARMKDEGRTHVGPADIAAWLKTASFDRQVVSTPRSFKRDGGVDVIVASVAGDFPGSPIILSFRFLRTADRISALEIG